MFNKLAFDSTNKVVEYEALILGLEEARKMKITKVVVFGDSEIVLHQLKGSYKIRHLRMRAYKNHVWDMIENYYVAFIILVVLREFNEPVDSLVVASNTFKVLAIP
jgi:ribonuclease HI